MRWFMIVMVLAAVPACSGSQTPERGPAFCESYETNYLGACQQECEKGIERGDIAGSKECQATCREDLKDDDTFGDDCPQRASQL